MEQGATEKAIIERSVKYNLPLPDAIKNAPELNFGLKFYYNAFLTLNKCRTILMGTVSPLTYFMYVDFCEKNDIIGEQRDDFIDILTLVDEAYLEHTNTNRPKHERPAETS